MDGIRRPRPADLRGRPANGGLPVLGARRRRGLRAAARSLHGYGGGPPHRRRGHGPAAPGRAGPVGPAARPGGGAGRLGPCAAAGRLRVPELPRAPALPTVVVWTPWRCCGSGAARPCRVGILPPSGWRSPAIIVGSQALHATGYTLGILLDGALSAAVAYFGDGASSEGDVRGGLRLRRQLHGAGRLRLPEQPVGHLGTGPAAVARLHRPRTGARATASQAWTGTTSWPSSPPPGSRWPGRARARGRR